MRNRHRGLVYVELVDNLPVRIFRSIHAAMCFADSKRVTMMARKDAVDSIRRQIFYRSKGECEFCGAPINWNFHMHEKIPRGKLLPLRDGGEISLENSVAICYNCHMGRPDSEHGNRQLRFGLRGAKVA